MSKLFAAIALSAAALSAQAAPVVVDFSFGSVASGSFSYDSSHTGVIGFNDLSAFNLQFAGLTHSVYDLGFLQAGNDSIYRGFAFDTLSKSLLTQDLYGFPTELTDIKNSFTQGFFVRDDMHLIVDYAGGGEQSYSAMSVTVPPSAVPEPGTIALLFAGAAAVLAFGRRRTPAPAVTLAA